MSIILHQHNPIIYRPSGIIGDSIVEYETPTRPVQEEVIDTEYQQFVNDGQHEITTLQSTGHTFSNALKSHERGEKNFDYSAQTVASAITTLDWLLCNKGYNSPIHPPPSPVLALVLSKYGRYLPVTRGSRVYSYMATNNIHNSQPFGQYKFSREHDDNIEA
ncbi:hypothetical protein HCN44_004508 [Aphidius gifuensis]|uniref:Uncharacterized protein n=1 Tax=Aphidius gifuensis TaxID=684658 RepID=A0A834XY71_APHGI|nr:hypothetical protein HCN44_004508 [Aphidius gifuensis]